MSNVNKRFYNIINNNYFKYHEHNIFISRVCRNAS